MSTPTYIKFRGRIYRKAGNPMLDQPPSRGYEAPGQRRKDVVWGDGKWPLPSYLEWLKNDLGVEPPMDEQSYNEAVALRDKLEAKTDRAKNPNIDQISTRELQDMKNTLRILNAGILETDRWLTERNPRERRNRSRYLGGSVKK